MSPTSAAPERSIRVCVLTEYFNPDGVGGTPSVIPELVQHIKEQYPSCLLEVLTSRNVYRSDDVLLPRFEEWEGIPVRRLGTPKSNQASTVRRLLAGGVFAAAALWHLLRGRSYDVLFVGTNPPPGVMAALALKRLRGTPYVYLIHDLFPDIAIALESISPGGRAAQICRSFQRRWLHGASRVIAIGRCMKTHIEETYGVPSHQVEVISNWADPDEIRPGDKQNAFREHIGFDGFIALYAGNFGQYQDMDTLLDAAHRLREDSVDMRLSLVGNGIREGHIRRRIADEGLSNVTMVPLVPKDEYPRVLAAADVCLVTLHPKSIGHGVPSKFYGILAAGRPIIGVVPSGSEIALVLEEEHCGVQVDPGDAEGLASAIQRLRTDPPAAISMGNRSRCALVKRFTLDTAAKAFVRVFEAVAKEQDPIQ